MSRNVAIGLLLVSLGNAGCASYEVVRVPPPPPPRAEIPRDLEPLSSPPEPGLTRVVLDANGVSASVFEVLDSTDSNSQAWGSQLVRASSHSENTRPVCVTPCEADLKPGLHLLRFKSKTGGFATTIELQVASKQKVVRVAFGEDKSGTEGTKVGPMLCVLGVTSALLGGLIWASSTSQRHGSDLATPGIALTLGGAAATFISLPLMKSKPDTHQESSTTEFVRPAAD